MVQIRNIWAELGLKGNPYHTDPLQATEADSSLYVHREENEQELGTFFASEDRGAIFVEGHVGVGKTTFINQTQYHVQKQVTSAQLLTSASIVEVQNETKKDDLVISIVSAVLKALRRSEPSAVSTKKFKSIEAYTKQAQVSSWSAGGSIIGFGGSFGKSVATTQPVTVTLQALQDVLEELRRLVSKYGFKKVAVLLNNLDNVEEEIFFGLLHDLRDTLMGRHGWIFVMAGPIGLRKSLSRSHAHRRVSERIAPDPVTLGPLTKKNVQKIIDARVVQYGGQGGKAPIPRRVIELLYDASGGEVRYILNRADSIIRLITRDLSISGPISEEVAFAALQKEIRDEIDRWGYTERQMEILHKIVKAKAVQSKDHAAFGLKSPQSLSGYLARFREAGVLEKESSGREAIYRPRGDVVLYFASDPQNGA